MNLIYLLVPSGKKKEKMSTLVREEQICHSMQEDKQESEGKEGKHKPRPKDFEGTKTYEFTLLFKDGHHTILKTLSFMKTVSPTDTIYSAIETEMMQTLHAMEPKWRGYGLWLQHEAVTPKYIFADVAYLAQEPQVGL